ncbi:MAG: hypothetical protein GY720_21805 [bacterium]|nr:hypothetical protein [bacterium]
MTRHIFRRSAMLVALFIATASLAACGDTGEQSSPASPTILVGRTLSAAMVGTAGGTLEDGAWNVEVSEVLWLRDEIYTERGKTVALAHIEVGMEVPVFVDVDLSRGESYIFIASHVEIGGSAAKVSAHGILATDTLEQVQGFEPPLSMLLYDGEGDTAEAQLNALVELLDEKWDRDRADRLGAEERDDPRTRQALQALEQLGLRTTVTAPADFDNEVGMSVDVYLKMDPGDRQLVDYEDMPARAVEELDLARVYTLVMVPSEVRNSIWAIGIRTDVGTIGPFVIDDNFVTEISLPAPVGGQLEFVVWENRSDLMGSDPLMQLATPLDSPELASAGQALVVTRDTEALVIDVDKRTMTWVSLDEAVRLRADSVQSDG